MAQSELINSIVSPEPADPVQQDIDAAPPEDNMSMVDWIVREHGGEPIPEVGEGEVLDTSPGQLTGTGLGENTSPLITSINRGTDNMQASLYAAVNALGEYEGIDMLAKWGEDGARENLIDAAINPAQIESSDDIESLSDLGTYVIEAVGENVPNIAAMAAGGGITTATRATIGKAALKKLSAKGTALAGAAVPSYGMGVGEVQNELKDAGIDAPGTAILAGIPIAGLDVLGLDKMVGSAFKDVSVETAKDLIGQVAKGFGKGAMAEMPTEVAQELITLTARAAHDPEFDVFSDENLKRLKEAGIKGGLAGGVFSGAGRGVKGSVDLLTNYSAELDDQGSKTTVEEDPPLGPTPASTVTETPETVPEPAETIQAGVDAAAEGRGGRIAAFSETGFDEATLPDDFVVMKAEGGGFYAAPRNKQLKVKQLDKAGKRHEVLGYPAEKPAESDGTVVQAKDAQGRTVQDVLVNQETPEFSQSVEQAEAAAGPDGTVQVTDAQTALQDRLAEATSLATQTGEPVDGNNVTAAILDIQETEGFETTDRPEAPGSTREPELDYTIAQEAKSRFAIDLDTDPSVPDQDRGYAKAGLEEATRLVSELGKTFGVTPPEVFAASKGAGVSGFADAMTGSVIGMSPDKLVAMGRAITDGAESKDVEAASAFETVYHEFGHTMQHTVLREAPDSMIQEIVDSYIDWLGKQQGQGPLMARFSRMTNIGKYELVRELLRAAELKKTGAVSQTELDENVSEATYDYALSLSEWWAEQVAMYIQSEQASGSPEFQSLLKRAADMLMYVYRKLQEKLSSAGKPEQSVKEFLDAHIKHIREKQRGAFDGSTVYDPTYAEGQPDIDPDNPPVELQPKPTESNPLFVEAQRKMFADARGGNYIEVANPDKPGKKRRVDAQGVSKLGGVINALDDAPTDIKSNFLSGMAWLYENGYTPQTARAKIKGQWKSFPLSGQRSDNKLGLPAAFPVANVGNSQVTWGQLTVKRNRALTSAAERVNGLEQLKEMVQDYFAAIPSLTSPDQFVEYIDAIRGAAGSLASAKLPDGSTALSPGAFKTLERLIKKKANGDNRQWGAYLDKLGSELDKAKTSLKGFGLDTQDSFADPRNEVEETTGNEGLPEPVRDEAIKPFKDMRSFKFNTRVGKSVRDAVSQVLNGESPEPGRSTSEQVRERRANSIEQNAKSALGVVKKIHEKVLQSSDAYLRDVGLTKIADMFHHRPGTTKTTATYFETVRRLYGPYNEKIAAVINQLEHKGRGLFREINHDSPQYKELISGLLKQKTKEQFQAEGNELGVSVREFFDELHQFLNANGVKVKYRKGYYPLVADIAKWIDAEHEIIRILRKNGYSAKQASGIYEAIRENEGVALEALELDDSLIGPSFGFMNQRKIPPHVYEQLNEYLVNDLQGVMTYYSMAAIKRVAAQRMWGVNLDTSGQVPSATHQQMTGLGMSVEEMKMPTAKLRAELLRQRQRGKITDAQYDRVKDVVLESYFGRLGSDTNPAWKRISSALVMYQNVRLLWFAVLSSLVDAGQMLWRAHDMRRAVRTLHKDMLDKTSRKELREFARMIGVIQDDVTDHVMNDQMTSQFIGVKMKVWNERFFRLIGMQQWTNATRVASLAIARDFIQRHAADPDNKESARYLKHLGLTPEKVKAWVEAGKPATGETHADVIAGLHTFIDESIVRPDATIRPPWGSDPKYMIFFHLKSFMWGFHEQILRNVWAETKNKEGAMKALPAITLFTLTMPMAMLGYETRREISWWFDQPEHTKKEGADYLFEMMQRAGYFGIAQLMIDADQAEQFGKLSMMSVAGPTVDQLGDFFTQDFDNFLLRATPLVSQSSALRAWVRDQY